MRAHHKRNLRFGKPDGSCWFHRTADQRWLPFAAFWSLRTPLLDLLFCAKHLFVAAMVGKFGAFGIDAGCWAGYWHKIGFKLEDHA
jgi:hypothetical protein